MGNFETKGEQAPAEVEDFLIKVLEWTKALTARFEEARGIEMKPIGISLPTKLIPIRLGRGNLSLLSQDVLEALQQI